MTDVRTVPDLLEELNRWRVRAARGTGRTRVSLRALSAVTGVPHNTLSNYLAGRTLMPADVLDRIVLALGATPAQAGQWARRWETATAARASAGATSRPADVPRMLPLDVRAFTGRERHLAELDELAARGGGTTVISAIAGTAGVGKTGLAVHWAHQARGAFPDGQLYVNLRGYDPGEPMSSEAAVEFFLRALGAGHVPADPQLRVAAYRRAIADRKLLILLDNAASAEQVRPLLPGSAAAMILVTSRDRLAGLVARDGAYRMELDRLSEPEALLLLANLLGDQRVAAEQASARALVRLCAGLPLALRVAAERVSRHPDTPLAAMIAQLADETGPLDVLSGDEDPFADVRAVFSWSYRALPHGPARLFRAMGLIPAADLDASTAACLAAVEVPDARRLLRTLHAAHLIEMDAGGRASLHDLLRAYAADTAAAADSPQERHALVTRYLDFCLHRTCAAADLVNPNRSRAPEDPARPVTAAAAADFTDAAAAARWLAAERANLVAAIRFAATSGWPDHAWRLAQALWTFQLGAGQAADWSQSIQFGLRGAEAAGSDFARGELLHAAGVAAAVAGHFDDALEALNQALGYRRAAGDRRGEASTLGNLGAAQHDSGRFRQAVLAYEQALVPIRESGHRYAEAYTLQNLAIAFAFLGRLRPAVDRVRAALALFHELGDRPGEACCMSHLAITLARLGEYDQALRAGAEAVRIAETAGAERITYSLINNIGLVHLLAGNVDQAEEHGRRAMATAREHEDVVEQIEAAVMLGDISLRRGDPQAALDHLGQARALVADQGSNRWASQIRLLEGDAHLALGDSAAADRCYEDIVRIDEEADPVAIASAEYGRARILVAGHPAPETFRTAEGHLLRALRVLRDADVPVLKAQIQDLRDELAGEPAAAELAGPG